MSRLVEYEHFFLGTISTFRPVARIAAANNEPACSGEISTSSFLSNFGFFACRTNIHRNRQRFHLIVRELHHEHIGKFRS